MLGSVASCWGERGRASAWRVGRRLSSLPGRRFRMAPHGCALFAGRGERALARRAAMHGPGCICRGCVILWRRREKGRSLCMCPPALASGPKRRCSFGARCRRGSAGEAALLLLCASALCASAPDSHRSIMRAQSGLVVLEAGVSNSSRVTEARHAQPGLRRCAQLVYKA